jgi:hypothetical protein
MAILRPLLLTREGLSEVNRSTGNSGSNENRKPVVAQMDAILTPSEPVATKPAATTLNCL